MAEGPVRDTQLREYSFPMEAVPRLSYKDPEADRLISEGVSRMQVTFGGRAHVAHDIQYVIVSMFVSIIAHNIEYVEI